VSTAALLSQFPRLSQYDPGVTGEGGLDPMGLASVADRIADLLAPGLRARMSQPRFVTLSAVGAVAGQQLTDLVATDGSTTFDIAFEWLVVEALVRLAQTDDAAGLPGSQKARRAIATRERLNAHNYLRGARVFGFTGVYRPFSISERVIDAQGAPGPRAEALVDAWERDNDLSGYFTDRPGSRGSSLRRDLSNAIEQSLRDGQCAAPPTGQLMRRLAVTTTPRGARTRERRELRKLVVGDDEGVRGAMTDLLLRDLPALGTPEHEIAESLFAQASAQMRIRLRAAIDYEDCATLINNVFRRLLVHSGAQANGVVSSRDAGGMEHLRSAAHQLHRRVSRAEESAAAYDDTLAFQVSSAFEAFASPMKAEDLFETLIGRHAAVQAAKGKRTWLDEIAGGWCVRPQYREQVVHDDDSMWVHPMRIATLAQFLRETR